MRALVRRSEHSIDGGAQKAPSLPDLGSLALRRLRRWRRARAAEAGDQAGAALEGQVGPGPVHRHGQAVAKADEKIDMGEGPEQPGREPLDPQPPELGDSVAATDGRQDAEVAVAE